MPQEEKEPPLDPRSVRFLNHTETPLELLTFPKVPEDILGNQVDEVVLCDAMWVNYILVLI